MSFRFIKPSLMLIFALIILIQPVLATDSQQQVSYETPVLVVNYSFLNLRTGPGASFGVLTTVVGGTELPVLGVARDIVWYLVASDTGPAWVNVNFTLPRGDFSRVPYADTIDIASAASLGQGGGAPLVSGEHVNGPGQKLWGVSTVGGDLRVSPSSSAGIVRALIGDSPNEIFPLLGQASSEGRAWYQIQIPNVGVGWVDRAHLRPMACAADESAARITRDTNVIITGLAGGQGYLARENQEVYVVGQTFNEMVQVEFVDGTVGQVSLDALQNRSDSVISHCELITTQSAVMIDNPGQGGGGEPGAQAVVAMPVSSNRVIVNTSYLNIRSGPSAGYSAVATVPGGTELSLLARASDDVWYLVQGSFGRGWLNNQFVIFRGDMASVPTILLADALDRMYDESLDAYAVDGSARLGQGGGSALVMVSDAMRWGVSILGGDLRASPDSSAAIVRALLPVNTNEIFPLLNQTSNEGRVWYQTTIPGTGTGWLDQAELRPMACAAGESVARLTRDTSVIVEAMSSVSGGYAAPAGTEVYVLQNLGNQVRVQFMDGTIGFVGLDALQGRPDSVLSYCDGVNPVRQGQGTPTAAEITSGQGGDITAAVQSQSAAPASSNLAIVNVSNLNIRSGPGAQYSVVATVAGGTTLAVVGRAVDGVWLLVDGSFGRAWINNEFVIFRGSYQTVPLVQ